MSPLRSGTDAHAVSPHSLAAQNPVAERDSLAAQETELRLAVQELEEAAQRALRPGYWIGSRPWLWTTGAFLLGAWIGGRR